MFGLMRLALVVIGIFVLAGPALAEKQEFPQIPVENLEVHVMRANDELMASVEGGGNGFMVAGFFVPGDGTYQQRLKAANDAIIPARAALSGYDFNAVIESRLRQAVSDAGLSNDAKWKVVSTDKPEPISASQNVLLTYTTLILSPDLRSLDFHVNIHLDRREPTGEREPRIRKRFIRSYQFRFIADSEIGNPLSFWNSMPRLRYEQLVDDAANQIAGMVAYDFSEVGRMGWWSKQDDSSIIFKGRTLRGHMLKREGEAKWFIVGKNWGRVIMGFKPVR